MKFIPKDVDLGITNYHKLKLKPIIQQKAFLIKLNFIHAFTEQFYFPDNFMSTISMENKFTIAHIMEKF